MAIRISKGSPPSGSKSLTDTCGSRNRSQELSTTSSEAESAVPRNMTEAVGIGGRDFQKPKTKTAKFLERIHARQKR